MPAQTKAPEVPPVDDEQPPAPYMTHADFVAAMDERDAKDAKARSDEQPGEGLYVLAFTPNGGGAQVVELHTDETAAARVSLLTYASKQHRRELADADEPSELPEGGGSHEINRKDIKVYKLSSSEVTDF